MTERLNEAPRPTELDRQETTSCDFCRGSGFDPRRMPHASVWARCPVCKGTGRRECAGRDEKGASYR